jgi:AbrB family looped-hinge helix DNA binding protein
MATTVGTKGQVVIEKGIRERLGVAPGSMAIQRLVDDHVEIYFVPPAHTRSLRGILASGIKRHVPPEEWNAMRDGAWAQAAREEVDGWVADETTDNRKQRK